jgi:CxxC motif-containing protein (DUF1111 family)
LLFGEWRASGVFEKTAIAPCREEEKEEMSLQTVRALIKVGKWKGSPRMKTAVCVGCLLAASSASVVVGQFAAHDPGVRGGTIDAGKALGSVATTTGLTDFFNSGLGQFAEEQTVQGDNNGLGPRFNSNACGSCHSQPAVGGTSPSLTAFPFVGQNPQVQFADRHNTLPSFITPDGPAREARFKFFLNRNGSLSDTPDGGVHDLFVISGRSDAGTCAIKQPNFAHNLALNNVIFRIPTPVFGAGLIENVADETILTNMRSDDGIKDALGITGHPNRNGNDGTITRFGWKAQNKSLEIFSGEAYNVEMGVTNELFQNERASPDEAQQGGLPANCMINPTPEDVTHITASPNATVPSDVVQFAMFMRLLAPPTASTTTPGGTTSIANGSQTFAAIGCALCHTPSLTTAPSSFTTDLSQVQANLFSDLLVHHMGSNLADGVSQGNAGPDEFRSAPLWGLGQRVFFLHDGRTSDLVDAIREHASDGSEANRVIHRFNHLSPQQQQDLLNFLRSL